MYSARHPYSIAAAAAGGCHVPSDFAPAAAAGLRRFIRGDRVRVTQSTDRYSAGETGTVVYSFGRASVEVDMHLSGWRCSVYECDIERIPDKPIVVDDDDEDIRIADLMLRAPAAAASSSSAAAAAVKVTPAAIARFQDYKRNGRLCSVPIKDLPLPPGPGSPQCPHCSVYLHHSKPAKLFACPDCERKWDSDRVFHSEQQSLEDAVRATPIEHVSVIAIGSALSDRTSPPTYEEATSPDAQPQKKKRKSRASSSAAAAAAADEPEAKAQHV